MMHPVEEYLQSTLNRRPRDAFAFGKRIVRPKTNQQFFRAKVLNEQVRFSHRHTHERSIEATLGHHGRKGPRAFAERLNAAFWDEFSVTLERFPNELVIDEGE
jgi:hypothetical protein